MLAGPRFFERYRYYPFRLATFTRNAFHTSRGFPVLSHKPSEPRNLGETSPKCPPWMLFKPLSRDFVLRRGLKSRDIFTDLYKLTRCKAHCVGSSAPSSEKTFIGGKRMLGS